MDLDCPVQVSLPRVDFVDVHAGPAVQVPLSELVRRFLFRRPSWVDTAMAVRDRLAHPFGLKRGGGSPVPEALQEGAKAGPFWILAVGNDEIVAGQDDQHLDFRVRFTKSEGLEVRTEVYFRNRFGRIYFALIRLGHVLVVRSMLKRTGDES